ncbi:Histone H1.4 [Bos mutus]|uniref:Histone H1.4 n=1 Tax=Bos mutus TaxID=72004 RepID=L8IQN8_9CETA|nr:PREDICTED: histone H1.4 [Bos mutus]ELR58900.1 Histone H1.4 [Bos mutus]
MSETVPAAPPAPSPAEKTPVKKKARKSTSAPKRKASGPSVSDLITKAVAASKERSGVSLAALKKALAAAPDVEKNNSRIKLGLKSLVSKGTLVQTKGTGASGSFKLNKKAATGEAKPKAKKAGAAKPKKAAGAAKKPKKSTGAATPKKTAKTTLKKVKPATGAKKVAKSPKKVKTAKPKAAKSPVKAKVNKPKVAKPKAVQPKKATPKK